MGCPKIAFAVLAIAATLSAADPFAGIWKLNTSKSKYKTGNLLKEQTLKITEEGGNFDVTVKGTAPDGTPFSEHYTVAAVGGDGKIIESAYDAVSSKRMGPNQREISYSKGGKVVVTVRARVSRDGKTMTSIVKGTSAAGQPVDGESVFEKQ